MDATSSCYKFKEVKKPHFASFLTLFCYEAKNPIRKKHLYRIKIRNIIKTYKGITTINTDEITEIGRKKSQERARVLLVSSSPA